MENLTKIASATSNGTATTVQSEAINIKSLGVKGDGSDEGPAFLAALEAAGGKELLLENITISMRTITKAGGHNVRLRATNATVHMLPNADGTYADRFWYIGSISRVSISGLEFDMQNAPGDETSGTAIFYAENCDTVVVRGCYAHDNGHMAFSPVHCKHVLFEDNFIKNTDSAIFVRGYSETIICTRNRITGGSSEGIGYFNSDNADEDLPSKWTCTNNIVWDKEGFAFNMCAALNGVLVHNDVSGCRGLTNLYDAGTGIPASRHSKYTLVGNNNVSNCDYGINNVGTGSNIVGNTFRDIKTFALGTNNYFGDDDTADHAPSEGVNIQGNNFYNICTDPNMQSGPAIWLYNLKNSTFIANNGYQLGAAYQGLKIERCENVKILNNNMDSCALSTAGNVDWSKPMFFSDNFFKLSLLAVPDPFTGTYGWEFQNTRFAEYDADPANAWYNIGAPSGVLTGITSSFIREAYQVNDGSAITSIIPSWHNRELVLQSGAGSFTIATGNNIQLQSSPQTFSNGAGIRLRYDKPKDKYREVGKLF